MSNLPNHQRRQLLIGTLLTPLMPLAKAATPTPSATEGPFYPTQRMRFRDVDNDLVRLDSANRTAGGETVRIAGQVLDRDGRPIESAVVEIWQCDVNGRYLHTADTGGKPRDDAFQGFGRDVTDADGRFRFRTMKPVPYPGRTPHIHVKVWVGQREQLTTQWYLPDHPDNQSDFLYQRLSTEQREAVSLVFDSSAEPLAAIQLVV